MQDDVSIVMELPLVFIISKSSNFRPLYHNMTVLSFYLWLETCYRKVILVSSYLCFWVKNFENLCINAVDSLTLKVKVMEWLHSHEQGQ